MTPARRRFGDGQGRPPHHSTAQDHATPHHTAQHHAEPIGARRDDRRLLVRCRVSGLVCAAAVVEVVATLLVDAGALATIRTTLSTLAAGGLLGVGLTQVPVVLGLVAIAAVTRVHRGHRAPTSGGELASRSAVTELARAQEHLHELRTAVVGISMSRRMLRESGGTIPDPARHRLQQLLDQELGRLERMMESDAGPATAPVHLGDALGPLVDSLQLRGHGVRWRGTECLAFGRSDHVVEVTQALLENSVRHASARGLELRVSTRGGDVEIRVSDRGPGIEPHLLDSLFQRGARGTDSPGQGLGLHIAGRLAEEMGGRLRYEAGEGAGATFVLSLPSVDSPLACAR